MVGTLFPSPFDPQRACHCVQVSIDANRFLKYVPIRNSKGEYARYHFTLYNIYGYTSRTLRVRS